MSLHETPDDVVEQLHRKVSTFFRNYPYQEWKKTLWEFYTCTIYNNASISSGDESCEILGKYESLRTFLKELNNINERINQYQANP